MYLVITVEVLKMSIISSLNSRFLCNSCKVYNQCTLMSFLYHFFLFIYYKNTFYLPLAGREIIKRIPCVCVCVLLSVCHAFIKGCTSHWLFLLGLFNVFYDLIAYVLSFDAVISHLGP